MADAGGVLSASRQLIAIVLIEEPPAAGFAAQELRGPFAQSKSAHPDGPVGIDLRFPSGILKVFRAENHEFDDSEAQRYF